MACNANRVPFLRVISRRGFAAACPRPVGKLAEVCTNTMSNKVVVATADSALPVTRISLVFRAGARNETYDILGASHLLRISAGLSTKYRTSFNIIRNLQQIGGSLIATSDREIVSFTIEATQDHEELCLKLLNDIALPTFKPWEIQDSTKRIRTQLAILPPHVRAIELVHKAAFREGLSNSIYISKHNIGKISSESLQHYYETNCVTDRCALVGIGIEPNVLGGLAQNLEISTAASKKPAASDYIGGEVRKERGGDLAHVAVAGQARFSTSQEAVAYAILGHVLGTSPSTKRGTGAGTLSKVATTVKSPSHPTVISSLNASYSDGGLFGFVLSADAKVAGKAVETAVAVLKNTSISAKDIKRAKALAKADVFEAYSTETNLLSTMATQAATLGCVHKPEDLLATIDAITDAEVQAVAKNVASSKLSVGAVGNLSTVPRVADIR